MFVCVSCIYIMLSKVLIASEQTVQQGKQDNISSDELNGCRYIQKQSTFNIYIPGETAMYATIWSWRC
jgi:hypothetical protein